MEDGTSPSTSKVSVEGPAALKIKPAPVVTPTVTSTTHQMHCGGIGRVISGTDSNVNDDIVNDFLKIE